MLYRPPAPQVSGLARLARRVGALAIAVGIIGLVGSRLGSMSQENAAAVLLTSGAIGTLALVLAAAGFAPIWEHGHLGGGNVAVAVLWGLIAVVPSGALYWALATYPRLTDVSTDTIDPPLYRQAAFKRTGSYNRAEAPTAEQLALQQEAYPDLATRRYVLGSAQIFRIAHRIVQQSGWKIADEVPARDDGDMARIEATARGFLSGIEADVVIRIYGEGAGTRIDLRSSSRTGNFDFGENAARIRDFLGDLDRQTGEG